MHSKDSILIPCTDECTQLDKMYGVTKATKTVCTMEFAVDANKEQNVDGGEQALLVGYNVIYV